MQKLVIAARWSALLCMLLLITASSAWAQDAGSPAASPPPDASGSTKGRPAPESAPPLSLAFNQPGGGPARPAFWDLRAMSMQFEADAEALDADVPPPPAPTGGWQFRGAPYLWWPETKGKTVVAGVSTPVDISYGDALEGMDDIELAVPVQVEVRRGPWNLWVDVMYMRLASEAGRSVTVTRGPLTVTLDATLKATYEQLITEFGLDYELLRRPVKAGSPSMWGVDLRVGGRYVRLDADAELRAPGATELELGGITIEGSLDGLGRDFGGSRDWIEPLVGAGCWVQVNDRLRLMARGDVGGFGAGSDFTWQVVAGGELKLAKWATLMVAYRLLDIDFEEGSGRDRFEFDIQMRGPIMALVLTF
jgi:hypothetical protein